ncbi:SagB-type dehydrogenase domain-containing protein [Anaerobranca californiensis DSM 14826]|uniref:SagB-type dehydrogenase domain-containing protein n=1 Tax=Anaerobranca californiensis DSM 14826 TaxID=1120989 RepID=A0A1M6MNW5_9FIRM|nr:SagB/ThcOx family dehydrogenase [Anaerobranca californiensis]SHJ85086.1 SagB-type dehydrogenase domain-containing protein [Anaerobranca californiensis DSM 14826]
MKEIGKLFMEYTKYQYLEESDQQKGEPQPPLEKEYLEGKIIKLPKTFNKREIILDDAIIRRRSVRKYISVPLTIEELAYLLWNTQGVISKNEKATLRTVPSAGARHPFHTYLLINNVENLQEGLYRYNALSHTLVTVNLQGKIKEELVSACLGQTFIGTSAVTFIWTVDIYRTSYRYGQRAYRYVHLDAGHVCQNLYLTAEAIDCGVCAIAAYNDDLLNNLLGLDGENEFAIYLASVGKI